MTLPALIRRAFSFTAFQQAQGDDSFPGTELDVELDSTNNTVDALIAALGTVLRADGRLQNGLVTRSTLAADVLLGVGQSRPWSAAVPYTDGETVTRGYSVYQAVADNTGVDPTTDTTGVSWQQVADFSQAFVVAAGGVATLALVDGAVTGPKLAAGAVGTAALADASITRSKAGPGLGVVPIGARIAYAGLTAPAGWLMEYGQAVSRAIYADLLAALTLTFTADTTTGAATLANASRSITGLGLQAAIVEGPGIPIGARLVSDADGNLALNMQATGTGAQVTIRVMPYGQGDGVSTFNLPDSRGRTDFGRDNMGGVGAGRLVNTLDGSALTNSAASAGAGVERVTLNNTNLPTNLPAASVTVAYPAHTYVGNGGVVTWQAGAGIDVMQTPTPKATTPPADKAFTVSQPNPTGGVAFGVIPPAAVTNKIIFAGV